MNSIAITCLICLAVFALAGAAPQLMTSNEEYPDYYFEEHADIEAAGKDDDIDNLDGDDYEVYEAVDKSLDALEENGEDPSVEYQIYEAEGDPVFTMKDDEEPIGSM